jgi:hypothetical protein
MFVLKIYTAKMEGEIRRINNVDYFMVTPRSFPASFFLGGGVALHGCFSSRSEWCRMKPRNEGKVKFSEFVFLVVALSWEIPSAQEFFASAAPS